MPATKKFVIQYPPGTGFALAIFPQGYQVISLFGLATVAIFGFGLLAIFYATTTLSILMTAALADLALYMMINPSKASYSMAPTMVVCALAGFLTAHLFVRTPPRHRISMTILTGLVVGAAVNFRLANLFLSAGYFLFFGFAFLRSRKLETFLQGGSFLLAYLVGVMPTLIANAINAGSPFSTTYGGDPSDLSPPAIDVSILRAYVTDLQFFLLILPAVVCRSCVCTSRRHKIGSAHHGPESRGECGVLHDPPHFQPILHSSDRHAFTLEPAVCFPDAADRIGG